MVLPRCTLAQGLLSLVTAAVLYGCSSEELPAAPHTQGDILVPQKALNGQLLSEERARLLNEVMARDLAIALADDSLRAFVYRSLQGSPYAEHKIEFARFTDNEGARLLAAMSVAHGVGVTRAAMAAFRDSTMALEVYLPVPGHLETWAGGPKILVATGLDDDDAPIAFGTDGHRVILSSDAPPSLPVLAVVPVESRFDRPRLLPTGNVTCTPTEANNFCDGGGGGGGSGPAPHGIYMTYSYLYDDGEGWLRGSPEIEVMLLAPFGDTLHFAKYDCANESALYQRNFNQDHQTWTGMVLLADSVQLEMIRGLYPPGTPWDLVRFSFAVWEDDSERCKIIADGDSWFANLTNSAAAVYGGYTAIAVDREQDPFSYDFFVLAGAAGLVRLVASAGDADDFLGVMVDKRAWNPAHPNDTTAHTHAIVVGGDRQGKADLVWWPAGSP